MKAAAFDYVKPRSIDQVISLLQEHGGFTDWFPLPSLSGEPTGHIDMFATVVAPLTVVVGQYDPAVDAENLKIDVSVVAGAGKIIAFGSGIANRSILAKAIHNSRCSWGGSFF